MKYIFPVIMSVPILLLPTIGNKSVSWGVVVLIVGYFWFGVYLGEEIGKQDHKD